MKTIAEHNAQVVQEIFHLDDPFEHIEDRHRWECKICGRFHCMNYNIADGHQYPRTHRDDYNANYPGYEGL